MIPDHKGSQHRSQNVAGSTIANTPMDLFDIDFTKVDALND